MFKDICRNKLVHTPLFKSCVLANLFYIQVGVCQQDSLTVGKCTAEAEDNVKLNVKCKCKTNCKTKIIVLHPALKMNIKKYACIRVVFY